jgi:hypothetical protein
MESKQMTDEVLDLGEFAAKCEVYACDPHLNQRERAILLARADRYRDLQLVALTEPVNPFKLLARSIVEEMEEALRGTR